MPTASCPPSFPLSRSAAPALVLCVALLAGCGAEVAGTAATVGKLQAEQASQARAQQQQIVEGMKQAQDAGLKRAADAASAGQ
ncbi:MAG: hypothetical protein IPF94_14730 [Betaproteobacteria bacterium]|nr:hypothetical protein [Betaproteobacteria bacterium]